ncbi:MAG: winged helix-turn-helix domain-containing protein [Dehalococcoidia bacterium]|nr:winged helix-turn-helix domain-containing protein [Dehalococcoidia bacterium]
MARTACFTDAEIARARQLRDRATTAMELRKALSVLLVAEANMDAGKASDILGISERTVFRNRESVRNQNRDTRNAWGGRRHCCMTTEEEREFLRSWEAKANEGGVISVPPVHAALVERLGHSIPMSTTYRLLARHGWRKVQPDTKHPKSDPGIQDEFKKNSPRWWRPPV